MGTHSMDFIYEGSHDNIIIDKCFNKDKANERKDWLRQYDPDSFVDHTFDSVTYTDFVNKELVHYSRYDVSRSIPCIIDGLKPGQRKVLFSCFKRNLTKEIKVA